MSLDVKEREVQEDGYNEGVCEVKMGERTNNENSSEKRRK